MAAVILVLQSQVSSQPTEIKVEQLNHTTGSAITCQNEWFVALLDQIYSTQTLKNGFSSCVEGTLTEEMFPTVKWSATICNPFYPKGQDIIVMYSYFTSRKSILTFLNRSCLQTVQAWRKGHSKHMISTRNIRMSWHQQGCHFSRALGMTALWIFFTAH